jgi:DNA end-binding protein Ku
MAVRPAWKGYLKLSLVSCPVMLVPATSESRRVRFHTINRKTGNRIRSEYVDEKTGKPVADEHQRWGYPRANGKYVLLSDEELAAVALDSARTIDIDLFAPKSSIEWIWYDTPHYLLPDGKVAEEAYAVIREAMHESGMAAIARLVLYRRERDVMLDAREDGIVLWTLRYGDEVRAEKPYFTGIPHKPASPKKLALVSQLIEKHTRPWSPAMMKDPVQQKIRQIIAAKDKGGRHARPAPEKEAAKPTNVVNIMDALKRSVEGAARRPAGGGQAHKPHRRRAHPAQARTNRRHHG